MITQVPTPHPGLKALFDHHRKGLSVTQSDVAATLTVADAILQLNDTLVRLEKLLTKTDVEAIVPEAQT